MFNAIANWWKSLFMSQEELYLNQSSNILDLENRMRSMEYHRWMNRTGRSYHKYLM